MKVFSAAAVLVALASMESAAAFNGGAAKADLVSTQMVFQSYLDDLSGAATAPAPSFAAYEPPAAAAPAPTYSAPEPVAATPVAVAGASGIRSYLDSIPAVNVRMGGAGIKTHLDSIPAANVRMGGAGIATHLDSIPVTSSRAGGAGIAAYTDTVGGGFAAAPAFAAPAAPAYTPPAAPAYTPPAPVAPAPVAAAPAKGFGSYLDSL